MASKKFSKEFLLFSGTGRLLPVRGVGAYASKREYFKPRCWTWIDSKLRNRDRVKGPFIIRFLSPDSYPVASLYTL